MLKLDIDRPPTIGERIVGFFVGLLLLAFAAAATYGLYRLVHARGTLPALIVLLVLAAAVGVYAFSLMWRTLRGDVRRSNGGIGLWLLGSLMSAIALLAAVGWWSGGDIRLVGYAVTGMTAGAECFRRAWRRRSRPQP